MMARIPVAIAVALFVTPALANQPDPPFEEAAEAEPPGIELEEEAAPPVAPPASSVSPPPPAEPSPAPVAPTPFAVQPYAPVVVPAPSPPGPERAPADSRPDEDDLPTAELGTHQSHWVTTFGIRTAFIPNEGLDPFATTDTLVQTSLGGGRTVFANGSLSVAAIAIWDFGSREAEARGAPTTLSVHRITAGPEVRWHLAPWLYGFARPMPAALHTDAAIGDATTGENLSQKTWLFGFDATAGAAVQVLGRRSGNSRRVRLWLQAEGGYGWSASTDLALRADPDGDGPVRLAAVDLGALAIRGGMFRVSANLTF